MKNQPYFIITLIIFFVSISFTLCLAQIELQLVPSNYNGYNVRCLGNHDGSIDLTVIGGESPFTYQWSNEETTEDISNLSAGYYRVTVRDNNGASAESEITLTEPEMFRGVNLSPSYYPNGYNVSCRLCFDGAIATGVESGIAPHTFQWYDGSITQDRVGLKSGDYELIVTDANGCTAYNRVSLTSPPFEGPGMIYVDNVGTIHSGKSTAPCNGSVIPIWQSLTPNTIFTCSPNVVGIGTYTIPNGMRLAVQGQTYFNGNTGMGITASPSSLRLAVSGNMAIGSSTFINSITNPLTNGLLIEGKVGIGSPTTFPGNYKLYVTGGILSEKVKVAIDASAGWADFVFEDNYKLMPLFELEQFIDTNNHLPNIPTTAEVFRDGIDVGEINSKLLQKIEELTLYLIDLEKRISVLEK